MSEAVHRESMFVQSSTPEIGWSVTRSKKNPPEKIPGVSCLQTKRFIKGTSPKEQELNGSCYFAWTQATWANVYSLVCSVVNNLYSSNVRLPGSVCFSVRVRYITTECNTLTAYCALSHDYTSKKVFGFAYIPISSSKHRCAHGIFQLSMGQQCVL